VRKLTANAAGGAASFAFYLSVPVSCVLS
jgi:hypothetical protein